MVQDYPYQCDKQTPQSNNLVQHYSGTIISFIQGIMIQNLPVCQNFIHAMAPKPHYSQLERMLSVTRFYTSYIHLPNRICPTKCQLFEKTRAGDDFEINLLKTNNQGIFTIDFSFTIILREVIVPLLLNSGT